MRGVTSPISSRKSVPPLASSKRPFRARTAPVNAPASWPKSSLSSKLSVRAPQLTETRGPFARGLAAWIAWAISSFPVPVSPSSRTGASAFAARRTSSATGRSPLLQPTMGSSRGGPSGCVSVSKSSARWET